MLCICDVPHAAHMLYQLLTEQRGRFMDKKMPPMSKDVVILIIVPKRKKNVIATRKTYGD